MLAYFLLIQPDSKSLYFVCFAVSSICYVILMVKNMIVFHDLDKMTGALLHIMPLVVMWNIHWNIRGTPEAKEWGFYDPSELEFGLDFFQDYMTALYKYYIAHSLIYYVVILSSWRHIRKNGYYCLLMAELNHGDIVKNVRKKYGNIAGGFCFLAKHFICLNIFNLLILPSFFSSWWSMFHVLAFSGVLIKRTSEYYIEFFPTTYHKNLEQLDQLGRKYDPLKMRPQAK